MAVGLLKAKQVLLSAVNTLLNRDRLRQNGDSRNFKSKNFGGSETHRGSQIIYRSPRLTQTQLTRKKPGKPANHFMPRLVVVVWGVRFCGRFRQ
jgi:hypothetical protein